MAFVRGDEELTVQVFGHNDAVNDSTETIWPTGGFIQIGYGGSAQTMTLTSAGGATDEDVVVRLNGLHGATWNSLEEEVTLGSDGTATTTNTFAKVNRGTVVGLQDATGDITVASSSSATTQQVVMLSGNTTGNATYTVPWGYTGYIDSISCNSNTSNAVKLVISIQEYVAGTGFLVKDKSRVINFKDTYDRQFIKPVMVPNGSTVELQAICDSGTGLSADFVMLLDKN